MFDIGGGELILIILGIIVLFGPQKLPEIAQMLGKGMQKVRQAQTQFRTQLNDLQDELKSTGEMRIPSAEDFGFKTTNKNFQTDEINPELIYDDTQESTTNSVSENMAKTITDNIEIEVTRKSYTNTKLELKNDLQSDNSDNLAG
jgi:sec-independent protein translocase protein TatA